MASYSLTSTGDNIDLTLESMDIVPSIYHLYGPYFASLAQNILTNRNGFPVTVRVQADVPHYTDIAVETITLAPGETQTVEQNPPLLPGVLEQLPEAKKTVLHVLVETIVDGQRRLLYEGTQPLTIWARGDVLLGAPGYYDPILFHATLATPNDPSLNDVLREAADRAPGGIIVWGYGDDKDSDGKVYHNLKAIYDAVAAGIPFVPPEQKEQGFYLQRLKLPYEVLQTRSGICVETSLLFASLYEKIELEPVLIRIPGHVFVAVPIAEGSSTYYFIETTLVGRASFSEAVSVGAREFNEALPKLSLDRLDSYFWLNVSAVRDEGIIPIPWR